MTASSIPKASDKAYPIMVNLDPGVQASTRDAFGDAMVDLGRQNPDVVALTADLCAAVQLGPFQEEFPDRYYNFGCAEQTMYGCAAGMATSGLIPFATTFACFSSMRACEQVRDDIAYPRLGVKVVGTHGGLIQGIAGTTHHATEDIAIIRSMANITILVPADAVEVEHAVHAAAAFEGPLYLRIGRADEPVVYLQKDYGFEMGKGVLLRNGGDATVIATGQMVHAALVAAHQLAAEGVEVRVINIHTIKPLDTEIVEKAASETRLIVTIEDHNIIGGLGSAVAEAVARTGVGVKVLRLGLPDIYAAIGDPEDLFRKYGMTDDGIIKAIRQALPA
jgi:transketolase